MAAPDTSPDWRFPSDYTALLRVGRAGFAWEFLRRNAGYRADAAAAARPLARALPGGVTRLTGPALVPDHWGLDFP